MGRTSYLEFSDRDYKYAMDMLKLGNYDPCSRFCQQSVEKRFKHYIEMKGTAEDTLFLSTHNLKRLYEKVCRLSETKIDYETLGKMSLLTDYYFDTNYPRDFNIELTKDMADEAVRITESINGWVDELLEGV